MTRRTVLFLTLFLFGLPGLTTVGSSRWAVLADTPVPGSAEEVCPLLVGKRVPEVNAISLQGASLPLKSVIAEKPTVVIFYRGGWCPFCNLQLGQLQGIKGQLREMGYQLLAISPDQPKILQKNLNKHKLSYLLMSDSSMAAARAFGIAFTVDKTTVSKLEKKGIDLESASGEKHHMLPVPSVFIVTGEGEIRFSYANPNYKVRLDPDVLLAAAKAALK